MDVTLDGWRLLRPGSGPGVVLSVDFTLARVRAQANFGDLARLLPEGPAVWGTGETCWPAASGSPTVQLEHWLRRSRDFGGEVRAVLGFCAGASLARALAERLADGGAPAPAVILLDPVAANAQTMIDQCDVAVRRIAAPPGGGPHGATPPGATLPGATLPGATLPDSALPGEALPDSALPDPTLPDSTLPALSEPPDAVDLDVLATQLTERYAAVAAPICAAQGVPPSITEQLCQRVEINLRYLALCATAGPGATAAALLVLSRDHVPPPGMLGDREVRLDLGQNELLGDADAALAVAGALAGDLASGRP
jgi:hypothetical protein